MQETQEKAKMRDAVEIQEIAETQVTTAAQKGQTREVAETQKASETQEAATTQKDYRVASSVGRVAAIIAVVAIIVAYFERAAIPRPVGIAIVVAAVIILFVGSYFASKGDMTIETYQCPKCGETFVPTYKEYLSGSHFMSNRRMTCPYCHEKVWPKKIDEKGKE